MPTYSQFRDMVSHRVTFDFDTGAKVTGYLTACQPKEGAVLLVVMAKVDILDAKGQVLEHHDVFSMVPNALTGVRVAEGPRGRDA
jgi:hypothetical protein